MKIKKLIIHCSESLSGDAEIIRGWHITGNKWSNIGYHLVILNGLRKTSLSFNPLDDGMVEAGRPLDFTNDITANEVGAHAKGLNDEAIGVCLIGINKFTIKQFQSLFFYVNMWKSIIPDLEILGHYETPDANGKTCPNIQMDRLRRFLNGFDVTESRIKDVMNGFLNKGTY